MFGLRLNFFTPKANQPSPAGSYPGGVSTAFASIFGPNGAVPETPEKLLALAERRFSQHQRGEQKIEFRSDTRSNYGHPLIAPDIALKILRQELGDPSKLSKFKDGSYLIMKHLNQGARPQNFSNPNLQTSEDIKAHASMHAARAGLPQVAVVPQSLRKDGFPDKFFAAPVQPAPSIPAMALPSLSSVPVMAHPAPIERQPEARLAPSPPRRWAFAAALAGLAGIFTK